MATSPASTRGSKSARVTEAGSCFTTMKAAIARTNQANPLRSSSGLTRQASAAPAMLPTTDANVTASARDQWMVA